MKFIKLFIIGSLALFLIGLLIPESIRMPVKGASKSDYNQESFWYHPWGKSITHKGVDIFAKKGTAVVSATPGLVLSTGKLGVGGNIVVVLGPKWRFHYYAHLDEIKTKSFSTVSANEVIGTVGNTGNARNTPSHLHYTIATPLPHFWLADTSPQGWVKMFYLNPVERLNQVQL